MINMKGLVQLTDKVYAVEVPSMAFGLMVNNYADESELFWMLSMSDIADDDNAEETLITKLLPPGTWRFLFTTKTATEEDARKVVKCNQDFVRGAKVQMAFYENYEGEHSSFPSAIASLESLLRSKGLDENKNYALIENKSSDE